MPDKDIACLPIIIGNCAIDWVTSSEFSIDYW